ncbi:prolyl-tRNA synthetase associated domain-containing protein [Enterovirga aerilata]|uniref:Prolyl-tRNA synthetase associated domain-containing protein n=1 Tax=Enterovirga aerilata TaxID=2730920 RepID=A0A849IEI1_9HYPH|nr:prolyl-tRNA synthetase associated domain-containing protein [Enterovirga sp. DB1703]NNM74387.1 prolyl-tRNA synthetase associated domain-containing protein [Enterovirga sp. DB1703]
MQLTPSELLDRLRHLGIAAETHEHEAVFRVAESRSVKQAIPGAHSKNLFLKDRKGRLFLVVAEHETEIDLKRLHETIGASGRLSFGSADLLRDTLGVEPGSVTPFAAANDRENRVTVILDEALVRAERVNFHPLVNTMTTGLTPAELLAFLRACGHEPRICRLPAPAKVCTAGAALPSSHA